MLLITNDQISKLSEARLNIFNQESTELLKNSFPSEVKKIDDSTLIDYVSKTIKQLQELSFEYEADITHALHMLFLIRSNKNKLDVPEDIISQFKDAQTSVEIKLEALEQVFIFSPVKMK